ncbi:universal stress protein [Nocardioides KLBMP 9356]|uniref:Universal stress protein n=1 Tax=Nocardioides potassii TaxID=2911371 RepID=A0ABS9H8W7_9ACTN|nr:universal stress protein [Nocardioides potassii]MCF6376874.1 universal stress protein [Nocardioides potassii]
MNGTDAQVVVGVGTEDMRAALAVAAEEAVRARCGLHLVRAVHVPAVSAETLLVLPEVEDHSRVLLAAAVEQAEELVKGAVPVTQRLVVRAPVPALVDAGQGARMVVLAHRRMSRAARLVERSVTNAVATRLEVPVVAVPSGWQRSGSPLVVAGIDEADRAEDVLRAAIGEARARGASLRLVHSFAVPAVYEDLLVGAGEVRRWEERGRAELCAAVDRLGDASVATEAEVVVRSGRAADVLLAEAADADLLVLGRHDPLVPIGSHLGPVVRAVLRDAPCPVLLITPRGTRRQDRSLAVSGRGAY